MIPVDREQLEGLSGALHLLRTARVDAPKDAYVLARVRRDRLPALRMAFLDEIEEHFRLTSGLSVDEASAAADLCELAEAAVRVQISEETLHHILHSGLVVNKDEGLLRLNNGESLRVIYPRGLQLKVSFEESPGIMLANEAENLDLYLARSNPPRDHHPGGYHPGEEHTE